MGQTDINRRIDDWIAAHRDELTRDLIELVNLRSVREAPKPGLPFGEGPGRVVDKALDLGKRYGYETENDDYYTVSFLRKGKQARELSILAHIDVVPEGEGWHFPPYDAKEDDGYILGRGTQDNKGPAIAALYVLRALDDLGFALNHTVRVIWGADEESNMEDVKHYRKTHPVLPAFTLVCDSAFPLCYGEKGLLVADFSVDIGEDEVLALHGGIVSNSVPDSAYIVLKGDTDSIAAALQGSDVTVETADGGVKISAAGVAGHAAFPENSVNAIGKLASVLTEKDLLHGKAKQAVAFLTRALADTDGTGLGIAYTDDIGTATTHVGGFVRFDKGRLTQNFNLRYAIHADQAELLAQLARTAADNGFALDVTKNDPPRYDSLDDAKLQVLLTTAREYISEDLQPFTMGGGTHARQFPNAIPYGPFVIPKDRTAKRRFGMAHGIDEAVSVQLLTDMIKIYIVTLLRLDALLTES